MRNVELDRYLWFMKDDEKLVYALRLFAWAFDSDQIVKWIGTKKLSRGAIIRRMACLAEIAVGIRLERKIEDYYSNLVEGD